MSVAPFLGTHERLEVWQKSMELLAECYRIAQRLPPHELYGLGGQLRRAALSVPTNIAEGCGPLGAGDRLRFLSFARGSLCEIQSLLAAAELLGYATATDLGPARDLLGQSSRFLSGLRRYLISKR